MGRLENRVAVVTGAGVGIGLAWGQAGFLPLGQAMFIGIAVDFRDDVLAYDKETPINYPLLIGEEDGLAAVTAMGMQPAFPFTVFADSQQRIVTVKVGELHRDEAELILGKVAAIDAGTLELAQAKGELEAGLKELAARRATEEAAAASGTDAAG